MVMDARSQAMKQCKLGAAVAVGWLVSPPIDIDRSGLILSAAALIHPFHTPNQARIAIDFDLHGGALEVMATPLRSTGRIDSN